MKKFVLFFLLVFAGSVFAACPAIWLNITEPIPGSNVSETGSFNFKVEAVDIAACNGVLTFEYDKKEGLGTFYRIPDSDYQPAERFFEAYPPNPPNSTSQAITFPAMVVTDFEITVTCNTAGTYVLRASESGGGVSNTVSIICDPLPGNNPPTGSFTAPGNQGDPVVAIYDSFYLVQWWGNDADGDPLTYTLTWSGPTSSSFGPTSNLSYTVPNLEKGNYTFTLDIDDEINPPVQKVSSVLSVLENTPPEGHFTSPEFDSSVHGSSYRVEWTASDPEDEAILTYTFNWTGAEGPDACPCLTGNGGSDSFFDITDLAPGDFYTFTVDIDDQTNPPETIESAKLFVFSSINTISLAQLDISPQAIYGEETVNVNLSVRNNSNIDVNYGVTTTVSGSAVTDSEIKDNIEAFEKASFVLVYDFSGAKLSPGDYVITIDVNEYFAGTSTPTGNTLKTYAYFTVKADKKSISTLPETNFFTVLLALFVVLLILKK